MPAEAISMRKLKEILRLKYEAKLAHRKIAKSLSISPGTVSIYVQRASLMGIHSWPLSGEWDDIRLHREFLRTKHAPRTAIPLPDWAQFHQELKKKALRNSCFGRNIPSDIRIIITVIHNCAAIINSGCAYYSRLCARLTLQAKSCSLTIVAPLFPSLIRIRASAVLLRSLWQSSGRQITPMPKPLSLRSSKTG